MLLNYLYTSCLGMFALGLSFALAKLSKICDHDAAHHMTPTSQSLVYTVAWQSCTYLLTPDALTKQKVWPQLSGWIINKKEAVVLTRKEWSEAARLYFKVVCWKKMPAWQWTSLLLLWAPASTAIVPSLALAGCINLTRTEGDDLQCRVTLAKER